MLTENEVTSGLAEFLKSQDYRILQQLTSIQKGVDIIAESKDGVKHYIEVKGETSGQASSKRFGLPFNPNQIWSHVSVALLKTLSLKNGNDIVRFAMAFPSNHEHLVRTILPSLAKLEIDGT